MTFSARPAHGGLRPRRRGRYRRSFAVRPRRRPPPLIGKRARMQRFIQAPVPGRAPEHRARRTLIAGDGPAQIGVLACRPRLSERRWRASLGRRVSAVWLSRSAAEPRLTGSPSVRPRSLNLLVGVARRWWREAVRDGGSFLPVRHPELVQDVRYVDARRLGADDECRGDLVHRGDCLRVNASRWARVVCALKLRQ